MTTPKAFHGCFSRLMRVALDSDDWITIDRSRKNRKKEGALREISNPNRVLNASFSNSKETMMHQEVAPKVQHASFPKVTRSAVTFKPKLNETFKKNSFSAKKPKNSLDKSFSADSANLLLLHKGLARHLQQLRIERHPVISKTKCVLSCKRSIKIISTPLTLSATQLVN